MAGKFMLLLQLIYVAHATVLPVKEYDTTNCTDSNKENQGLLLLLNSFKGATMEQFDLLKAELTTMKTDLNSATADLATVKTELALLKNQGARNELMTAENQACCQKVDTLTSKNKNACPIGYQPFKDSCYKAVIASVNWTVAREKCREDGAHLVIVKSKGVDDFVWGLQQTAVKYTESVTYPFFWTDGHDQDTEGVFKWESTGEAIIPGKTYTNFWPGEPNDHGAGQDCLHIGWADVNKPSHLWDDVSCSGRSNYVCEREN